MSDTTIRIEDDDGFVTEWPWPDDRLLLANGDFVAVIQALHDAQRRNCTSRRDDVARPCSDLGCGVHHLGGDPRIFQRIDDMSDTKRAADSKFRGRGLESDGANPSEPADVLDAIACEVGDTFIDCWHMAPTEQWRRIGDALASAGWVLVKADGLSHGDELEPVGFNGHLRVVPRTPAADDPCPHCDDGTVWEDGVVGSCCEVCGGTGLRSDTEDGER